MVKQATPPAVFVSTGAFANVAGCSATHIKRMCDEGHLAYIVVSPRGDRRIPLSELDRLLAEAEANREGAKS